MIKYRQKVFFWQYAVMGGLTGAQMLQQNGSDKERAEQEEKTQELIKEQNRKLEKLSKVRPEVANVMQERTYGLANVAKDVLKNKGLRKELIGSAKIGGLFALGSYGAQKYIQHDMKKNELEPEMLGQNTYSEKPGLYQKYISDPFKKHISDPLGKAIPEPVKKVGKKAGGVGVNLGFGAAFDLMEYKGDKAAMMAQKAQTRNFSLGRTIVKGIASFGSLGLAGNKNMAKLGERMVKEGGVSGKIGNFMMKHDAAGNIIKGEASNKALIAGIVPGFTVASAPMGAGEKAVELPTRALDPGAYKYKDIKNGKV